MKLAIRSMVTAPAGKTLLSIDLSQAEAWVVAYLSEEAAMKHPLQHGDIHSQTGRIILDKPIDAEISKEERYLGKKCNHAFNYKMGPARAAEVINGEGLISISLKDAKQYREAYVAFYTGLQRWWTDIEDNLKRNRTLTTPHGIVRKFYGMLNDETFKEATAYIPQTTVADHMFGAIQPELGISGGLREVYRQIIKPSNGNIKAINTSHDSVILEIPTSSIDEIAQQASSLIRRPLLVNGETFTIPTDCEVGDRWGELEKLKVA